MLIHKPRGSWEIVRLVIHCSSQIGRGGKRAKTPLPLNITCPSGALELACVAPRLIPRPPSQCECVTQQPEVTSDACGGRKWCETVRNIKQRRSFRARKFFEKLALETLYSI